MIDFHSHILPGIDDGPETLEESVEMAAILQKAGFKTIYCTPHLLKGCFEADKQAVLSAVSNLQAKLNAENIDLEILPGREYYLDEFLEGYLKDPLPLGKTQYILIEIPNSAADEYVKETCFRIKCGGFVPMIAHPERCRLFVTLPKQKKLRFLIPGSKHKTENSETEKSTLTAYLQEIGCAFQGNLGSFNDYYGPEVRQTANDLREKKIFTHYGTDAHSVGALMRLKLSSTGGSIPK